MKYLLLILMVFSLTVFADEPLIERKVMLTDSGRILLDNVPCTQANEEGFLWKADATDASGAYTGVGVIVHEACWFRDGDTYFIWFHSEDPTFVITRHKSFFKRM